MAHESLVLKHQRFLDRHPARLHAHLAPSLATLAKPTGRSGKLTHSTVRAPPCSMGLALTPPAPPPTYTGGGGGGGGGHSGEFLRMLTADEVRNRLFARVPRLACVGATE